MTRTTCLVKNMVQVKLSSIVEGIEFQSDESQSYLKKSTGEVLHFADDEINVAESNKDVSEQPDWYIEAVKRAKELLENEQDYIPLPSKYDFHEYRVIEKFILSLPIEEQRDELIGLIKGKGAFARFHEGLERFLLRDKWYQYRNSALSDFARDWCEENDIDILSEN